MSSPRLSPNMKRAVVQAAPVASPRGTLRRAHHDRTTLLALHRRGLCTYPERQPNDLGFALLTTPGIRLRKTLVSHE